MPRFPTRWVATSLVAAVAACLTACGDNSHIAVALPDTGATLQGTVKYGGEEVQYALVVVQTADGKTAAGMIGEDGHFHIVNAPVGEVKVGVNTTAARGAFQTAIMQAGAMTGSPDGGKTGRKKVNLKFVDVPAKYIEPGNTGLTTTIKKGENTYDVVLPR